ncbi:MAG: hypothetical protein PHQ18_01210 [Patescibacteria group bacterium]|nr:hypothetical protein [Patescibacteria group bacterium]
MEENKENKNKKIIKWTIIIILGLVLWQFVLVALPFIALWYLWKKTSLNKSIKIIITIVLVSMSLILFKSVENSSKQAEIDKTLTIQITEPMDNTTTTEKNAEIKGNVNLGGATIKINGRLIKNESKEFAYDIPLSDMINKINVVATKGEYTTSTSLTINRELTKEEKATLAEKQAQEEAKQKEKEKAEAIAKAEEEKQIKQSLSKMRVKEDDIKNITYYTDKSSPKYTNYNGFYLNIIDHPTLGKYLSLSVQYSGNDWLFINSYIIKTDDQTFTLYPDEVKRDNSTYVWEWSTFIDSDTFLPIVKAIITSKETKIRYQGSQYYHDRVISNTEKQALQNVLDAFDALKKQT